MNSSEIGLLGAPQVTDAIVPIGELRANPSEKIREIGNRRRPLVVTQDSKAAAVLLSPEEFDPLTSQAHFAAAIQEGLEDYEAGRVIRNEDLGRRLYLHFGRPSKVEK